MKVLYSIRNYNKKIYFDRSLFITTYYGLLVTNYCTIVEKAACVQKVFSYYKKSLSKKGTLVTKL